MDAQRKRKRASLSESGGQKKTVDTLVEQAAGEMRTLHRSGNLQLENYLRLHCREALQAYLERCPLLQCCDAVQGVDSDAFVDPFVELAITRTHPVQGVCFALETYLTALRALVTDAMGTLVLRDDGRQSASPCVLSVQIEQLDVLQALGRANLLQRADVSISNDRNLLALHNDRELDYLSQYVEANYTQVQLFVLSHQKRLVCAMIVPARAHNYTLQLRANQYISSYATLEQEVRDLRRQLNEAKTPVDEAKTHDKRIAALEQLVAEQENAMRIQNELIDELREQRDNAQRLNDSLEKQCERLKQLARKAVEAKTGRKANVPK